jgi:hypothetical protein
VLGTLVVVEKLPPLFDLGGDWGMRMGGAEDGDRGRWGGVKGVEKEKKIHFWFVRSISPLRFHNSWVQILFKISNLNYSNLKNN